MLIFHIATPKAWHTALNKGIYECESLKTEGFIHCSTQEQLLASANKHFANFPENQLIVLHIPEKRVRSHLQWEPDKNGNLFPHLYSKLPIEIIQDISLLARNEQNLWDFEK